MKQLKLRLLSLFLSLPLLLTAQWEPEPSNAGDEMPINPQSDSMGQYQPSQFSPMPNNSLEQFPKNPVNTPDYQTLPGADEPILNVH